MCKHYSPRASETIAAVGGEVAAGEVGFTSREANPCQMPRVQIMTQLFGGGARLFPGGGVLQAALLLERAVGGHGVQARALLRLRRARRRPRARADSSSAAQQRRQQQPAPRRLEQRRSD